MSHSELKVHLNGYSFDPLNEGPVRAPVSSATDAPEGPAHYIIQFARVLTQEERARIQGQYGLRLTDYVPEFAYLEQLSPQQLASLSTDPLFRASTPYQAEFKISPGIGQVVFRSAARNAMPGLVLRAVLFSEADPASVVAALEGVGASATRVLDDRAQGGPAQIQFVLSSQADLPTIAGLEDVRWIEEVPEINLDNGNTAGTMQSGTPGDEPIWNQGLHGEGQIIGIIDGVVDMNHCWFRDAPDNTPGPAHRKVVGLRNSMGGAADLHGTFVAGIVAGDDINNPAGDANRGNAWAARITSGNSDDLLIASLFAYLTAAAADGAFIHTNSWHIEPIPQYSQEAADVDAFVWNNEDHLVLGSSGNAGEAIGPPGTAKNALCISATQRDPNEMSFGDGNNGPTSDGRRKPEIFAPGCSIVSARANTLCTVALDQVVFGFPFPICATSWATPAVAAAAALIRQYYTEGWYPTGTRQPGHGFIPSGALLKATLLNATIDMTAIAGYPGNQEGWDYCGSIELSSSPGVPALFGFGTRVTPMGSTPASRAPITSLWSTMPRPSRLHSSGQNHPGCPTLRIP